MESKIDKEVLEDLVNQRLTGQQIAEKLGISKVTANRNMRKLGLKTKAPSCWESEEYRAKHAATMSSDVYRQKMTGLATPELRAKLSTRSKDNWANPEHREKMLIVFGTGEFKEKVAKAHANPEYREKMTANGKAQQADSGYLERHNVAMNTPECREKISALAKARWGDHGYREKMTEMNKARWENPEYRGKMAKARENQPRSMTKPHQNVCDILTGLDTKFEIEKAIGFYNFDLYLPDHKILIEVQGEYWHSLPNAVRNDKAKATYIERYQPELKLHYIWEYECGQPNKVIEKLKYWCGLTKLELVNYEFKDLTVGSVDKKEANELLTTWHYLDSGRNGIDYGVYLNGELIAMARWTTIGRQGIASHVGYEASEVLELARLCVHPRYQKKNLLTWFLSRVEKDIKKNRPEIKCLVSFSDMSQGHTGAVYKAANWEQVSTVSPSYYYIDKDGYVMNKKKLYTYAVRMKTKEASYAESHGFIKVPTLEKHKFIRRLE